MGEWTKHWTLLASVYMSLQMVAALTLAITEDLMVQANASRTVGSHLKQCKCCKESSWEKFGSKKILF